MGNYSKNPQTALNDAIQKGYARVRFQQGKPILDRELNLMADLAAPNRLIQQSIGNGVPDVSNAFLINNASVKDNNFTIKAGRCIVNGYEVVLANDTTYKTQPHKENVQPFFATPASGAWIYLRVFTVEVNESQDADLRNSGDIGFETALRERVEWEVRIEKNPVNTPDHFLLANLYVSTTGMPPPEDTSSAKGGDVSKTGDTTESAAVTSTQIFDPVPDDEPIAVVTDLRVTGLRLSKVRQDLETTSNALSLLMDNSRSGLKNDIVTTQKIKNGAVDGNKLAEASVTLSHLSMTNVSGNDETTIQLTIMPSATSTVVLMTKGEGGVAPFIMTSIWSNGSFTFSEKYVSGDRVMTLTNTSPSVSVSVNIMVLKFNA